MQIKLRRAEGAGPPRARLRRGFQAIAVARGAERLWNRPSGGAKHVEEHDRRLRLGDLACRLCKQPHPFGARLDRAKVEKIHKARRRSPRSNPSSAARFRPISWAMGGRWRFTCSSNRMLRPKSSCGVYSDRRRLRREYQGHRRLSAADLADHLHEDGVVQDYVFNDNTTNSTTNAGMINGVETHSATAPTPEPAATH